MSISNELKYCKERVETILRDYPTSRDSDKVLIIKYLSKFHGLKDSLRIEAFYTFVRILEDAPSFETIRRLRQRFQEGGLYMGTKRLKRLEEEKRVRQVVRRQI